MIVPMCYLSVAILVQALLTILLVGGLCFRLGNQPVAYSLSARSIPLPRFLHFFLFLALMSDFVANPAADEEILGAMEAAGAAEGAPPILVPGKGKGQFEERVEELLDEAAAALKGKGGGKKGGGLGPEGAHSVLDPGALVRRL